MTDFLLKENAGVWFGFFPRLEALGFTNAFTCRFHGESDLVPDNLNLALHVGDNAEKVLRNRKTVAGALGIDAGKFTACQQVHGDKIAVVDKEDIGAGRTDFSSAIADKDALITAEANVPLMLFFADCVPVVLADPLTGAVGIAHAGWRGSTLAIAAKTACKMAEVFGTDLTRLVAAIGPSIGPCCYEVDEKVFRQGREWESCFHPTTPGHWQLDLWQMNRLQLLAAGLKPENVLAANICTEHNRQLFFSYRAEKGRTGRLSAVILRKQ